MKTVFLLGELGQRFGRKHLLDVSSPAEAIRALCANFRDFRQFVSTSAERHVGYRVLNRRDAVGLEELHYPASQTITFAPVVAGAGFFEELGKFGQVLLGGALIVASFYLPPLALIGTATLASVTFSIGVSLTLGGIAQLLAPAPKTTAPSEGQNPSYIFNGAVNTTAQGQAIPVGYGRLIVGSAVISAGIRAEAAVA